MANSSDSLKKAKSLDDGHGEHVEDFIDNVEINLNPAEDVSYGRSGFRGLADSPYVGGAALLASLGGFSFGYDQGVISIINVMKQFHDVFPEAATPFGKGFMTGMLEFGAFLGCLFMPTLADKISRKRALAAVVVIFNIGAIMQTAAPSYGVLVAGRTIGGIGVGTLAMGSPIYISEIAPPNLRGTLLVLESVSIVLGVVVSFFITYGTRHMTGQIAFRLPLGLQMVCATGLGIGILFYPYSPRWLALVNRPQEALDSLVRLRRLPADDHRVQAEHRGIISEVEVQKIMQEKHHPGKRGLRLELAGWLDLFSPRLWRRTAVAMGVANWGANPAAGWGAVAMAFIFVLLYGVSYSPLGWALPAEVYPNSHRSKGVALATATVWLFNFIVGVATPPMMDKLGFGTYVFFGTWCFIASVWAFFLVPETKGKTLEQMDEVFKDTSAQEEKEIIRQQILSQRGLQPQGGAGMEGNKYSGRRHVQNLIYRVPRASVVAVCSTEAHELEWARSFEEYKEFNVTVYGSYEEMLSHPGLQAVWISTSTDVHASQTLAAIKKGLHVLCEKPLSTKMDEIAACVDAAKARPDLKVMAGFSRRFDASYRDAATKIFDNKAIGNPFIVRSNTCDLLDNTGFFVRYAPRNGGIFVDCAIHDIDLSLWYLSDPVPKSCWATGTLQHHPELAQMNDVDNGVGVVEFWGGKIAYFYCSRTQAHGHDVCTEVTGTEGKVSVNVVPRANNVVVADKLGIRNEVQPEYWQRFEDAFALEANEFTESVLRDKPVPLPLEKGVKVMEIGRALQDALLTGEVQRFNEKGERI
ncbi:hypothetical protein SGCOL_001533 [Colletotrichum sp. CLE4]